MANIAQKPLNRIYINDINDLPKTLSDNTDYIVSGVIDIGNGSIDLPLTSTIIGIGRNAEIVSTNATPITGTDWKLRVMGIKINGVPTDNGAVVKYPSIKDVDILSLTTMVEGEVVWCSNQKRYVVYSFGQWVYLDDNTPMYVFSFKEDFESGSFPTNISVVNDTPNQWIVGSAGSISGNYSAYISNDGINPTYTNNHASISHFYFDVTILSNATAASIEFLWKGEGELNYDYGRLYKAPTTYVPTAGSFPSGTGVVQLGLSQYNNQSNQIPEIIDLSAYIGQTIRLIFTAKNDWSVGTNPLWIVDNIIVKYR